MLQTQAALMLIVCINIPTETIILIKTRRGGKRKVATATAKTARATGHKAGHKVVCKDRGHTRFFLAKLRQKDRRLNDLHGRFVRENEFFSVHR